MLLRDDRINQAVMAKRLNFRMAKIAMANGNSANAWEYLCTALHWRRYLARVDVPRLPKMEVAS